MGDVQKTEGRELVQTRQPVSISKAERVLAHFLGLNRSEEGTTLKIENNAASLSGYKTVSGTTHQVGKLVATPTDECLCSVENIALRFGAEAPQLNVQSCFEPGAGCGYTIDCTPDSVNGVYQDRINIVAGALFAAGFPVSPVDVLSYSEADQVTLQTLVDQLTVVKLPPPKASTAADDYGQ